MIWRNSAPADEQEGKAYLNRCGGSVLHARSAISSITTGHDEVYSLDDATEPLTVERW